MNTEMPIRAKPYAHQKDAYDFALRLFGVVPGADEDEGGDAPTVSRGCFYLMDMG